MIVGNPTSLAIESQIVQISERPSQIGLGYFRIHVGGSAYGVKESDATMLGCSYNEVRKRLSDRSRHTARFSGDAQASEIARAFREGIYSETPSTAYFGMPLAEFQELFAIRGADIQWAPDGDEAFDDGSYVLQFDVKDKVRLIAFMSTDGSEGLGYSPSTLKEAWLDAEYFYGTLRKWLEAFDADLSKKGDGG